MEELIIQEYLDGNSISKLLQKYYNKKKINKYFNLSTIIKPPIPYFILSISLKKRKENPF